MRVDWQRTASFLFCLLVGVGILFLVGRYLLAVVLPFLIAWGVALVINPLSAALSGRTKLPRRLCTVLVLLVLLGLFAVLLTLGVNRLAGELGRLADRFASGDRLARIVAELEDVGARIPFLGENEALKDRFDGMLTSLFREVTSEMASTVTAFATGLLRAMPSIVLFVVVTVIASFYFALELDAVHRSITSLLPASVTARLPAVGQRVRRFLARYLRVYLFLMFITFCQLFAGFTVLRVDYAFLLALAVAFVDVFPVLGVGTVLVPWSLVSLLERDFRRGFGLLILWAVITVVRQVTEPRIVGETIGLHPLLTLISMYVGFRLFSITGMLLAPALVIAVRTGLREWMPRGTSRARP